MGLFYVFTRPNFFFFFFKLKYFSHFPSDFQTVFTIVYRIIRRLHKKKNILKKKSISRPPGWFYFTSPGPQETIFYLRVAQCIVCLQSSRLHVLMNPRPGGLKRADWDFFFTIFEKSFFFSIFLVHSCQ